MPWYSMTAIYHWERMGCTLPKFERRTTICSAADETQATERLLAEAKEYPAGDHIRFWRTTSFKRLMTRRVKNLSKSRTS